MRATDGHTSIVASGERVVSSCWDYRQVLGCIAIFAPENSFSSLGALRTASFNAGFGESPQLRFSECPQEQTLASQTRVGRHRWPQADGDW